MNASQYTKLMNLLKESQEDAEQINMEMRTITRHEVWADAEVVAKDVGSIKTKLSKAVDILNDIASDRIKKAFNE